jgi:hypothetical protein
LNIFQNSLKISGNYIVSTTKILRMSADHTEKTEVNFDNLTENVQTFEQYFNDFKTQFERFNDKGVKKSSTSARDHLKNISTMAITLRKQIQAKKNAMPKKNIKKTQEHQDENEHDVEGSQSGEGELVDPPQETKPKSRSKAATKTDSKPDTKPDAKPKAAAKETKPAAKSTKDNAKDHAEKPAAKSKSAPKKAAK